MPRRWPLLALSICLAGSSLGQERTLFWKALDVQARLGRDGDLRITERHQMVFSGDWNGGERRFRLEPGQQIELHSVQKIDGGEASTSLTPAGGSIGLHEYLFDGSQLRWRARRSSDRPFRNSELTYRIDYSLRGVLKKERESYVLHHDFAFADRPGVIERFSLALSFDPQWTPTADVATDIERTALPPGQSVVLAVPLTWSGQGRPRFLAGAAGQTVVTGIAAGHPPQHLPLPIKIVALVCFLIGAGVLWLRFMRSEASAGRFAPAPEVNRLWLDRNLLVHRPEVVGAAWDSSTGQSEVAALIAIMSMEGKIETIAGMTPRLRLLVPRERLSEYEKQFVERLFIAGDEIEPQTLRKHYASSGFDPAGPLRLPLAEAAAKLVGKPRFMSGCALAVLGFVVAIWVVPMIGGFARAEWAPLAGALGTFLFLLSLVLAASYRGKLRGRRFAKAVPAPVVLFGVLAALTSGNVVTLTLHLGAALGLMAIAAHLASWKGTAAKLENLRTFHAAREFFIRLLEGTRSDIDERWVPYVLAFGLGPELDRWSVAAPPAGSRVASFVSSGSGSGSRSTSPPIGGGGGFGGAGATGGWASSIATFAAAVPSPGSASSGGSPSGGSSGGSSSGGGGGGGW